MIHGKIKIKHTNTMKILCFSLLFGASLVSISPAQAINVITFDDLDTSQFGSTLVPYQYQNFHWSSNGTTTTGFTAINDAHWTGTGNYNNSPGAPSAPNGVLNSGIVTVSRIDGGLFTFKEAYFAPFTSNNDYPDSQGSTANTIIVQGYDGGTLIDSASYTFTQAGYVLLAKDIPNITSLVITGTSTVPGVTNVQTRWAMDNFAYEPVAVPLESDAQPFVVATAFFAVGTWWKKRSAKQ
jgi:hypothetical protein